MPGIVRSDFQITDNVMSGYVMSYYVIIKNEKVSTHFLKKGMNHGLTKIALN